MLWYTKELKINLKTQKKKEFLHFMQNAAGCQCCYGPQRVTCLDSCDREPFELNYSIIRVKMRRGNSDKCCLPIQINLILRAVDWPHLLKISFQSQVGRWQVNGPTYLVYTSLLLATQKKILLLDSNFCMLLILMSSCYLLRKNKGEVGNG